MTIRAGVPRRPASAVTTPRASTTVPTARVAAAALGSWLSALSRPAVAGNGAQRYQADVGAARVEIGGPTAVSAGKLALLMRARGEAADLERAVPDYGRPPDITVKKSG